MAKKREDRSRDDPKTPFNNPFGALSAHRDAFPPGPNESTAPEPERIAAVPARAVVRYERAGRGGREVTLVERLDLPPAELKTWLASLKRALACGGAVEEGALVFQGDQRERLREALQARGILHISIG